MTRTGHVYGGALYELARAEGLSDRLLSEISVLAECFHRTPDFLRLLDTPNLSKDRRWGILEDCFRGKVHPYVLNFLKILTGKGGIRHFTHCWECYLDRYNRDNGILPVQAVTAVPLAQEQTARLTAKLSSLTGRTVRLTNRVEPNVLGGVCLEYDGKSLDDTLSHRLDGIRALLKNTVME